MSKYIDFREKIFSGFNSFLPRLKQWKYQKEKIVFTNGCFDILHRGHVEYLAAARKFGDKLVVGLNADSSVKILKGDNRPVHDQEARAVVLAALQFVDAVIIFDEETPENLIRHILPDVLVKGKDYRLEEVAGHDIVLGHGGKVELLGLIAGYSSSEVIKNIRER